MAKDNTPSFEMHIDPKLKRFLRAADDGRLQHAREKALLAAGMAWADHAKGITRLDKHVDTGLYLNSIGVVDGSPAGPGDAIHELSVSKLGVTTLDIGSNVAYAAALEERFSIMTRALDRSFPRMLEVAEEQVRRVLFG